MKLLSALFAMLIITGLSGQVLNNGGFEEVDDCPPVFSFDTHIGDMMVSWFTVQGTPDGYHQDCPAMVPSATPGIPEPYVGSGMAGFYAQAEAIAHKFDQAMQPGVTYCISLDARLSTAGSLPANEADSACSSVDIYGVNALPEWSEFGTPVPIASIPGMSFMGKTAPVLSSTEWQNRAVEIVPDSSYSYLVFAGASTGECPLIGPYICVDEIAFSECTSINVPQHSMLEFSISPNPASQNVWVRNLQSGDRITLRNALGQMVLEQRVNSTSTQLTVNEWPAGVYLIAVTRGQNVRTQRLVIE